MAKTNYGLLKLSCAKPIFRAGQSGFTGLLCHNLKIVSQKSFGNNDDGESNFSDTNEATTPVKKQPDLDPKRYTSQNWLSDYAIDF